MLIHYSDIKEDFETVLNRWFLEAARLKSVYDLFFSNIYKPVVYLETHFRSLIQAIESYHRSTFNGYYLEQEEYEKYRATIVAAIPDSVPSDLRASLKSRLKYGNEHSLRKRLTEVLKNLPEYLRELVTQDMNSFVGQVIDTRNYLTHYDESTKERTLLDEQGRMVKAIKSLRALLIILLLDSLKVKHHIIVNAVRKYHTIPLL